MSTKRITMLTAAVMLAAAPAFAIGVNLDFLWNPDPGNDTQVFLHVSNMAYQPPRAQVREVYPRLKAPESEFPVVLFLANEANVSLSVVWNLKMKGLTWVQVMSSLGVPPQRVFVEMPRDPGPPYGKAYGHWKNHPKERVVLTDDDVFYWVNVRSMARYFGVEPSVVAGWRDSGRTWKNCAATEYRGRKGKDKKIDKAGASESAGHPSKGKGKGH
jgi:hypothetical protein